MSHSSLERPFEMDFYLYGLTFVFPLYYMCMDTTVRHMFGILFETETPWAILSPLLYATVFMPPSALAVLLSYWNHTLISYTMGTQFPSFKIWLNPLWPHRKPGPNRPQILSNGVVLSLKEK